jgi:hypothetical protein
MGIVRTCTFAMWHVPSPAAASNMGWTRDEARGKTDTTASSRSVSTMPKKLDIRGLEETGYLTPKGENENVQETT